MCACTTATYIGETLVCVCVCVFVDVRSSHMRVPDRQKLTSVSCVQKRAKVLGYIIRTYIYIKRFPTVQIHNISFWRRFPIYFFSTFPDFYVRRISYPYIDILYRMIQRIRVVKIIIRGKNKNPYYELYNISYKNKIYCVKQGTCNDVIYLHIILILYNNNMINSITSYRVSVIKFLI